MRILVISTLIALNFTGCCSKTIRDTAPQLKAFTAETLSKDQQSAVQRYAPCIIHHANPNSDRASWDIPTAFDFDQRQPDSKRAANQSEEWIRSAKEVPIVVYYALVETKTHYFITYHLYHALDWDWRPAWLYLAFWHENDGENLQVVVRKATERSDEKIEILTTQAHLSTTFTLGIKVSETGGLNVNSWPIQLHNETHPIIKVEKGGHGIYGASPKLRVSCNDFVLTSANSSGLQIWKKGQRRQKYELRPIHDNHWSIFRDGKGNGKGVGKSDCEAPKHGLGDGGSLDQRFCYQDIDIHFHNVPRHYDSDRLSFFLNGKYDAGILPFAFSDHLFADDLGVFFFHPASKYASHFSPLGPWSTTYNYNPYRH